jgi:hypothetical protein
MNDVALIPASFDQLPATQIGSSEEFDDLAKGGDFLARLQLCSKDKYVVSGLIQAGHWGIPESADEIVDLGKSIDVIPLARRPKAVDLNDKDAIITSYDVESSEFKRIRAKAGTQNSKCMFGPSFLLYERSTGRFLEFFCGSKSTRAEAKKVYPFLAHTAEDIAARDLNIDPHGALPFTLNNKLVEKKDWRWHAPIVVACSTPFTNSPPRANIIREVERFLNPSTSELKKVEENAENSGRAR